MGKIEKISFEEYAASALLSLTEWCKGDGSKPVGIIVRYPIPSDFEGWDFSLGLKVICKDGKTDKRFITCNLRTEAAARAVIAAFIDLASCMDGITS